MANREPKRKTIFCSPEPSHCSINKLVELMQDPLANDEQFYCRHAAILDDFIAACPIAFWMQDLSSVIQVIQMIVEDENKVIAFRAQLTALLELCGEPPLLRKSSEILECTYDLEQFFSLLGYVLLTLQDAPLRDLVFDAIYSLLDEKRHTSKGCVTNEALRTAVTDSEMAEIVGQYAEIADEELYTQLLELLAHLALVSDRICQVLVNVGAIRFTILRLDPEWQTRDPSTTPTVMPDSRINHYEHTSLLLWLLFQSLKPQCTIKGKKGLEAKSFWSLRYTFRVMLFKRGFEFERTSVLALILKCLCLFPDMPFVQSGLADDIALLSVATEVSTKGTWAEGIHFTTSPNDYELKKMLLLCLCNSFPHCGILNVKIFNERQVLRGLVRILKPGMSLNWSPDQHCKLTILTLDTLQMLLPNLKSRYGSGLTKRLINLILQYTKKPYNVEILHACLRLMTLVIPIQKQDILISLKNEKAIEVVTALCDKTLSESVIVASEQRLLGYGFHVLQRLYKYLKTPCLSSVNLCLKFMDRVLHPTDKDPVVNPTIIVFMLDFLWEAIVWYEDNLKAFISQSGIYGLLDMLETFQYPIKLQILGMLVDFAEEGSCIPYLLTWRRNGKKFVPLLMEIFRDENRRIGVKSTPEGIIFDIEIPLMGEQQWYETFCVQKKPNTSPATVDFYGSVRPKVYALLQMLTNRHQEKVTLTNETYKLGTDKLVVKDQITMLLAENYFAFKLSEVWVELKRDLEILGFRPISVDAQLLQTLSQKFYQWSLHIKELQTEMVKRQNEQRLTDEKSFYSMLMESRLCESLRALQELNYIARTTEFMFQLTTKMNQTKQIQKTLKFDNERAYQHRTYNPRLSFTPVFGQTVNVEGNTITNPDEFMLSIRSVSPIEISRKIEKPISSESEEELILSDEMLQSKC